MPGGISTSSVRSWTIRPVPSHSWHGCSTTRPTPPQREQVWVRMNSPNAVRETCSSRPAPPRHDAEQVVAEERREQVRETAEVEARRREAPAAQPRVAVAVIELAGLALGQDFVRLDDLAEALLRVGRIGYVWMERAGEPAERLFDLGVARGALDAKHLVVVPLGRRHRWAKRSFGASCLRRSLRGTARARGLLPGPSEAPCRSPSAPGRGGRPRRACGR